MVTGTEVGAAIGGLKAAFSIVKGLHAAATQASLNEVKIELGEHILTAQAALTAAYETQATTAERIRELEQEIVRLKDWSAQKERYELADAGQGSLAYRLKDGMEAGEPAHWICPNCYEHGEKSLMKHETLPVGRARTLVCHPCGLDIVTHGVRQEPPRTASSFGRGGGRR